MTENKNMKSANSFGLEMKFSVQLLRYRCQIPLLISSESINLYSSWNRSNFGWWTLIHIENSNGQFWVIPSQIIQAMTPFDEVSPLIGIVKIKFWKIHITSNSLQLQSDDIYKIWLKLLYRLKIRPFWIYIFFNNLWSC